MVTVSDGAITLRDDGDPNVRRAGIWGLKWQNGGYAQVGDVLDTDDDREEIRRALLPGWPLPPAGSQARLDNSAFPGDPARMGIDFTEVHFAAPGEETPAWFVPGTRSTWLIYVHGKGADRWEALRMLPATAALGFPALVITYRNDAESPSSGGRYGYGASEWPDLEAAVRYALAHGASDVALVGFSMGGAIIMRFIDESALAPSVHALILDSPATDLRTILLGEMRKARGRGYTPGSHSGSRPAATASTGTGSTTWRAPWISPSRPCCSTAQRTTGFRLSRATAWPGCARSSSSTIASQERTTSARGTSIPRATPRQFVPSWNAYSPRAGLWKPAKPSATPERP